MITMLQNWKGAVEVNGVCYENINDVLVSILLPKQDYFSSESQ